MPYARFVLVSIPRAVANLSFHSGHMLTGAPMSCWAAWSSSNMASPFELLELLHAESVRAARIERCSSCSKPLLADFCTEMGKKKSNTSKKIAPREWRGSKTAPSRVLCADMALRRRARPWAWCARDACRLTTHDVPAARTGAPRGGAKANRNDTAPGSIRVASLVVSVFASVWPVADCVALSPVLAFSGSVPVAPPRPASYPRTSVVSGRTALLPLRVRGAAAQCSMVLSSNSRRLMGDKNDTSVVGAELEKVQLSAGEIWRVMMPTDKKLQFRVGVSVVLLVLCRLANIMVPLTFKAAIDILTQIQTGVGGRAAAAALTANAALLHAAMSTVAMFFVWKLTQGLGEIARQYLWVAVQSDLKRRISERLLGHLHSLSFRFHVSSKSGQTLQIMDKGTSALESLMEILPFRLFPALCDVILVCGVFLTLNKPTIAAIAGGTIACYSVITYVLTKWRTKYWREMVMSEITYKGRAVESLQNVETVKYFAAEKHEVAEYSALISSWQAKKLRSERTLAILNTCQKLIICAGLTAVMYVSVGSMAAGSMTVGDLVMTVSSLRYRC